MRIAPILLIFGEFLLNGAAETHAQRPLIIVDETRTVRREPPPHGAIGMSTAFRISYSVPERTMEFRKRILDVGSAIGTHPIAHDEVYYVLSGRGEVSSSTAVSEIGPGMAAYLYRGERVGIRQTGSVPLALIIAYPIVAAR